MIAEKYFNDYRTMEEIGPETYKTEDDEIVITKIHTGDFSPKRLAKYIELCEDSYDKYNTRINLYIIMDPNANVTVKQMDIKSHADFTIKLACGKIDPIETALKLIGQKIIEGTATQKDYEELEMLPLQCKKEKRLYYREKVLEMLNMIE